MGRGPTKLSLKRWSQVTCVKWLPGISNNGEVLCFGTGRGLVLIYHQLKDAEMNALSLTQENIINLLKSKGCTKIHKSQNPTKYMFVLVR